jgi:hypothetical protein
VAIALGLGSLVVAGLFWAAGRIGFGPLAAPPGPDDPAALLPPPDPAPEGWLRPGWLLGLPVVWVAASLLVLPLVVYVISYIPWAFVENHQLFVGWPPGHTGQTLLELTGEMYRYHNGLTAAHPASSPWWAWPMNLKPVWFYQESLGAGTAAALYDAGSLVIWWMGIPAIAFTSWMAYKRRSPALALIAVGFAAQWIPWARIDRAAFQYHYYTARRSWSWAGLLSPSCGTGPRVTSGCWPGRRRRRDRRAGGAVGVDRPLCAIVGVDSVNPNSAACPAVIPDFVLTVRTAALAVIAVVGLVVLAWRFIELSIGDDNEIDTSELTRGYVSLAVTGGVVAAALFAASFLPDTAIVTLTNLPVEPIAILAMVPLGYLALQVYASRDAHRYVIGFVAAAVGWFAILYPNISALPLPAAVVNAYQGILPTYLSRSSSRSARSTGTRDPDPHHQPSPDVVLVLACLRLLAWSGRDAGRAAAEAAAAKPGDAEGPPGAAGPEGSAPGSRAAVSPSPPAGG